MDDGELRRFLEETERRMMRRINDNHEALLSELRNLRSEHDVTRQMVTALPATVLGAIEKPLLNRNTRLEARVSRLEPPDTEEAS